MIPFRTSLKTLIFTKCLPPLDAAILETSETPVVYKTHIANNQT